MSSERWPDGPEGGVDWFAVALVIAVFSALGAAVWGILW